MSAWGVIHTHRHTNTHTHTQQTIVTNFMLTPGARSWTLVLSTRLDGGKYCHTQNACMNALYRCTHDWSRSSSNLLILHVHAHTHARTHTHSLMLSLGTCHMVWCTCWNGGKKFIMHAHIHTQIHHCGSSNFCAHTPVHTAATHVTDGACRG